MSGERIVGLFSGKGQGAVAERGLTQAHDMVFSREADVIQARPRDKWFYAVPVLGSKDVNGLYLGFGEGTLATQRRVGGRLKHTAFESLARFGMGRMFARQKVNSLNLNGELPRVERMLLQIQTGRGLVNTTNVPWLGAVVKLAEGFGTPFLKAVSRDSLRAKIWSAILNPFIGSIGAGLNGTVLGSYLLGPLVSTGKFENGLDAGDQIADLATFAGYLEFMQNPRVPEGRKMKIARAFIDQYDKPPTTNEIRRHEKGLKKSNLAKKANKGLEKVNKASRQFGMYVNIPLSVVLNGATRLSRGSDPDNPPRSMHGTVDKVLEVAGKNIADLQTKIAAAKEVRETRRLLFLFKRPKGIDTVDAEVALATWQYRLKAATLFNDIYKEARKHVSGYQSRYLPRTRR